VNKLLRVPGLLAILYVLTVLSHAQDIKVSASVNRTTATDRDVLLFSVTIDGTTDFPEVPPPESPDFVVISGPSMSSSIQIINGQVSATKNITWQIAPTRTGRLTIQPLKMVYRGKTYTTEPITVTVTASQGKSTPPPASQPSPQTTQRDSGQDKEVFLKAVLPKTSIYKGEELDVAFDLYYRNIRNLQLKKMPDAQGFWIEQFPDNSNPPITSAVVNGIQYRKATIKEIALFPNTTGVLTLDPLVLDCEVLIPAQRRRSIFDDFFDDSFFNDPFFGGSSRIITVRSDAVKIYVKPLPENGRPASFTGAVGRFQLESTIDTLVTTQNQALTLRYTITGSGNISTLKLPAIDFPNALEVFEPKINKQIDNKSKPIRGSVTWEYVMIPRRAGTISIPAVVFSYFDPQAEAYRTLTSRSFSIKVNPSSELALGQTDNWRKEEISLLGQDIRFIMRNPGKFYSKSATLFNSFWFWLFNGFSVVMIAGTFLRRWWLTKISTNQALVRRYQAATKVQQKFKKIDQLLAEGMREESFSQIYSAVTGFIADRLNLPAAGIGTREIENALAVRKINPDLVTAVTSFLSRLDEIRFLPQNHEDEQCADYLTEARRLVELLAKEI